MLKLLFKTGFPKPHAGQYKLYVFEVMLNDGTTRQAVADNTMCGDVEDLHWKDPKTKVIIPQATVLGWRETYNCDAARQDIDTYLRDPISIVTKDHVGDAFARHIDREPCPGCRNYYEIKSSPVNEVAEKSKQSYACGFCPASFLAEGDLYAHQQKAHDPDGIMFSEIGLPK